MLRTVPRRVSAAVLALTAAGVVAACSGTAAAPPSTGSTGASVPPSSAASSPAAGASSASAGASASSTPAGALVLDITLANGTVTPNGDKYDVTVGQTVVLNVTSDHDDEIHVHSEPEVELEVKAGVAASTQFVAQQSGSFEVEAHHPEKIIAILNVR